MVTPIPFSPTVTSPIQACEGTTLILSATGSGTGDLRFHDSNLAILGTVSMAGNATQNFNAGVLPVGNYTFYVTEFNGSCASAPVAIAATVQASPLAPVGTNDTICAGNTATLTANGTVRWYADAALTQLLATANSFTTPALTATTGYYLVASSPSGCNSPSAIVTAVVNPLPAAPVVMNDTICQGNTAVLTAMGAGGTLQWYAAGMQPLATGDTLFLGIINQTTPYYVRETDVNGCVGPMAVAQVIVLPRLTPPSASPVVVCDGEDVVLTATGSRTGELVFYNTANLELGRTAMTTLNPQGTLNIGVLAVGNYSYRVAEAQSTCISDQVGISVQVRALPAAPAVFNDGPACAGDDVFVQAAGISGATYHWTGPNGFVSNNQTFGLLNVTAADAGAYTLTIFVNGCNSLPTTTTVGVNALPVIASVSNNGPLCEGDPLNLSASVPSGVNFEWTGPNGFSSTSATPSILNVREVDHQGFYGLVVVDPVTGCRSAMVSTLVMINTLPQAGFIFNPGPVCEGDSVILQGPSVLGGTYAWTGPNDFRAGGRNAVIRNLSSASVGTYTLTITANSCSVILTTDVSVRVPAATSVHPDTTIELGSGLRLYATGGVLYQWTPGDFLSETNIPTPFFVPTQAGVFNYAVRITDLFGCSSTEEVQITVTPTMRVLIPDLFTPNGDGVNDTWILDFLRPLSGYQIRVFSRGGLEVFTSKNYASDWDGTHYKTGKILPDGTYFYIITLSDGTEFRGPVTIKR
jgi:gliding motility-associated-like protein